MSMSHDQQATENLRETKGTYCKAEKLTTG